jgi:hypothetical protein
MDREFPAPMCRVMLIDSDKVGAPADPLTGLRPFENVIIVQEFAGRFEVICLHCCPESLDNLFTILWIVCHERRLYIHEKGSGSTEIPEMM